MIVCICNRLNEQEIYGAIAKGARRAEDVHACCGTDVNCGCCLDTIDEMVDTAHCVMARQLEPAV